MEIHEQQVHPAHGTGRYRQELSRTISVLGNVLITLSGITPAASVFIIAPVALAEAGSGAFTSFVFAAIVGVFMGLCWAELSAAFPIAGGDYALVWHSFRGPAAGRRVSALAGPVSFITFALYLDFIAFIPATIALGAGTYFGVIANVNARLLGAIFMLIAAGVAIFKIRFNAILTGIFLGIELIALLIVTVLGFSHPRHFSALVHPAIGNGHGLLVGVAFSGVLAVTAVAIFSYNGYNAAVNFAEETQGTGRNIARAILIALAITVAAELIPLTATIVGSPSLAELTQSAIPMQYFIEGTSSTGLYDVLSVLIVLAILNATIAIILSYARILFSAARDRAFPGPTSGWMAQIQPRFRSPWVATAVIGVVGAVLCLTVSLGTLVNLTGASLVADYALIAIAALVARPVKATEHSPYKMRFWPLPPLLALVSLTYVFTKQTALLLNVTLITMGIGLVYWLVLIMPQRGRAWHILDAASSELAPPDASLASAGPAGAAGSADPGPGSDPASGQA